MNEQLEKGVVDRNSAEAKDRFVRGVAGGKAGGVDLQARTVSGIASTINVDRDGEIILPAAFKARLGEFQAGNSPFLAAHTHRSQTANPTMIGWVQDVQVAKADVRCVFRFATTDAAEQWWKLASDPEGKGIAFSIGFIPTRWVYGSVVDLAREFPEIREAVRSAGLADEDKLRVLTEIELLEISAVAVPANREALQLLAAKSLAAGPDAEKVLAEFRRELAAEVVRQLAAAGAGPEAVAGKIAEKIEAATAELRAMVIDQIDEIKALLPDDVTPGELGHDGPGRTNPGGDAAQRSDGAAASSTAASELADALSE